MVRGSKWELPIHFEGINIPETLKRALIIKKIKTTEKICQ